MAALSFATRARSGAARTGRLVTPHGVLDTPAFFPVGTYGAVRGLTPEELRQVGVQGVLANTYHLHLRPGEETVRKLGGLHGFMGWDGPMLTDSGGYQLYSLDLSERSEEGVRFRSPIDGSERFLSPETAIGIQEALGADLIVQLDEFEPIADRVDEARVRQMLERTLRWGERCQRAKQRSDQWLFGIVQGGGSEKLRRESAARTRALGFDAFAIGGLGVGESPERRWDLLDAALEPLPDEAPHYLMGLGTPDDLVAAVARGVDLFDCVIPTRHGRHGWVFTDRGPLNLRNARFREDVSPIEEDCPCPVCTRFSRAYLRHLIVTEEALGARLSSLHNLAFYMRLLARARDAITGGAFDGWSREWRAQYAA
ncbi:MAG: tRNA guanosine(34) transglycosylase Tgt [Deltaproteobacteria bacterium]|nr:tRNA guanosine(34) transglycosylase Tgt [Deltaproteobacteria bacterium]